MPLVTLNSASDGRDLNDAAPSAAPLSAKPSPLLALIVVGWLACVAGGSVLLNLHASTPGEQAAPPAHWPATSHLPTHPARDTLLLFLHPSCPCSRTTLSELEILLAETRTPVTVAAILVTPSDEPQDWTRNELWRQATAIPNVRVLIDQKATEADRFHVRTSGQTLLYDLNGTLLFSGGITAGRGHAGDNLGRQSMTSHLAGTAQDVHCSPTFGCPLFTKESPLAAEEVR